MVAEEDEEGDDQGEDRDGLVLAAQESLGAFANGVGDDAHVGGTGIAGEDRAGEDQGGDEGEDADA